MFGRVIDIFVLQGGTLLLCLSSYQVVYFDEHYHAYLITESPGQFVLSVDKLTSCYPFVIHPHTLINGIGPFLKLNYIFIP